ncbi:MAG: ABC transporter permease [Acidimicrobiales bacterium]
MTGFLTRRIGQSILAVIGVTIIVFILIHMLPGGPARAVLGGRATPIAVHQFMVQNGYNRSLPVQYGVYVWRLLHGNFGYSYHYNQGVGSLIYQNLPKSALLVGIAYAISVALCVPMGIWQAVRRNKFSDYALTTASYIGYAMPTFWAGILLITFFSIKLQWFPSEGPQGATVGSMIADPAALVLPVATLVIVNLAMFSRFMRSSVVENLVEDYVRTARGKGVPERIVLFRHVLRNSLLPIISLVGLSLPVALSGAVVAEAVFNYPGMGLLFWTAAVKHDYPLLMGFTVVIGVATVTGSLLADVCYAAVDPRVRHS